MGRDHDGAWIVGAWQSVFGPGFTNRLVADCMGWRIRSLNRMISGVKATYPQTNLQVAQAMREIAAELLVKAAEIETSEAGARRNRI
jgi:hypothetical protein